MPLDEYRRKRDFSATPEPGANEKAGAPAAAAAPGSAGDLGGALFVIQEHHARARHFDLRLELGGVLVSWAVPKGPSFDPADKRLAMHVEDHPIAYASFEGVIPAGQYGAGTVIVWDTGTWAPVGDPVEGMKRGDFKFELHGSKLHGRWVLVRIKPRANEHGEPWLFIKERDDLVRPRAEFDVTEAEPRSVLSGKTIPEMAEHPVAVYGQEPGADGDPPPKAAGASRTAPSAAADAGPAGTTTATLAGAAEGPLPYDAGVELATLVERAPAGPEWISEVKYDGYRMLAAVEDGRARIWSRNSADWTERLSRLARALETLPASSALLDGEICVFDDAGVSHFQDLQQAIKNSPEKIAFASFDLLYLNGYDLRGLGLAQRKELLHALIGDLPADSTVRYVDHVEGAAPDFHTSACTAGLEGSVVKRIGSPYLARRTRDWLKVKCLHSEEFVVGGFTEPKGGRGGLGALLLGCHDADGGLRYRGRVGTGFSEAELDRLRTKLDRLERKTPPFENPPHVTASDTVHWVTPTLVAQVSYTELTAEGHLRHPAYLGLREDKAASEVVCEIAEQPPAPDGMEPAEIQAAAPSAKPKPARAGTRAAARDPASVLGVAISNPDKRLFPESTFSKLDFARYYERVAPLMLPEVSERFLTLVRCPSGEGKGCFYQRHPERAAMKHVRHTEFHLSQEENHEWLYVDSPEGLVELAQRGVNEIHMWCSRADAPQRPDRIVFDLDPGPDVDWKALKRGATIVRDDLQELGFEPFVKTTGGKGLHVVVAIEPVWEFERIKPFTKALVDRLSVRHPDLLVAKMSKKLRVGRIYLDYLRNFAGSSAVAPYSTRNRPGPTVAVPVTWDELTAKRTFPVFSPTDAVRRIEAGTDPWADLAGSAVGARVLKAAESTLAQPET